MIRKAVIFSISMSAILSLTTNVFAFKLPDSGQTKCYQGVDPYGEIECANTGQDGEYAINPMSYTSNGDGTVTDNNTGLMWQKCSAGQDETTCSGAASTYNWYVARGSYHITYNKLHISICGFLQLGGHNDWRLPTKKELITIVDYSKVPTYDSTVFPNTSSSSGYWTYTSDVSNPVNAWSVLYAGGIVGNDQAKSEKNLVRCVRGVQTSQALIDNGNGTVTDARTGLVWQKEQQACTSWNDGLSKCNNLYLAGHSEWRVPNIKELESLTDDLRYDPAINTDFIPNLLGVYSLSSTTNTAYPGGVHYVYFTTGSVGYQSKLGSAYVRCVSGGESGGFDNFVRLMHGGSPAGNYTTLQDAIAAVADGDTVQALAMAFSEPLTFDADYAVLLQGGYDSGFTANPGFTTLNGSLTISDGTVTVENLSIR
jgi:hypothetical protein